ncbi:MAG TPA: DUF4386 domain-containing protein [Candidatus Eisenbacteria bacterium]|jgi:hypothetical protein
MATSGRDPIALEPSQRTAARVVGLTYLLALPPAIFAEFVVLGRLVSSDAAETARNVVAHERLFRLGIASNLGVFTLDVVLIAALYVTLKPVHRGFALLAVLWRMIETTTLVGATLNDFTVLRLLSGVGYLHTFEPERLHALARLAISAHGAAYNVGLFFAGLGSTVFCCLWFKSGFIPKALAAWGVIASALLGACAFTFIVFPEAAKVITVVYYGAPIFTFELTTGLWLTLRGIRPPTAVGPIRGATALADPRA